jgi:hypothetical protein
VRAEGRPQGRGQQLFGRALAVLTRDRNDRPGQSLPVRDREALQGLEEVVDRVDAQIMVP